MTWLFLLWQLEICCFFQQNAGYYFHYNEPRILIWKHCSQLFGVLQPYLMGLRRFRDYCWVPAVKRYYDPFTSSFAYQVTRCSGSRHYRLHQATFLCHFFFSYPLLGSIHGACFLGWYNTVLLAALSSSCPKYRALKSTFWNLGDRDIAFWSLS